MQQAIFGVGEDGYHHGGPEFYKRLRKVYVKDCKRLLFSVFQMFSLYIWRVHPRTQFA